MREAAMSKITRAGIGLVVALVVVGLLAAVFALRDHVPEGSAPPAATPPSASAAPPTPTAKPAPRDTAVKAPDPNTRLLDAYLFFLAAFESHRSRGR